MNIDNDPLRSEYNNRVRNFHFLIDTVKFTLQTEIDKNKIKCHSFTHRIKSFDSFVNKIRRKNISDPFKDIHDLLGFRIVCLFLPDLELIGNIINREFDVFEEDDKIDNSEVNIFGYMDLQYKAKLKINSSPQALNTVQEVPFEIQVRTITQDAWASISHYLFYKRENLLPKQLRRDFHALSGLFYVADTHFTMLEKEQLRFFIEETLRTRSTQHL